MTAEIAIVNRHAIALAADSAVTIGRERVWKSSNKLFSLGPVNDIGIMVSGFGEFAGIPWEPIVKLFREERGYRQFDTTKECASEFIGFLDDKRFVPDERSRIIHLARYLDCLEALKGDLQSYKRKTDFRSSLIRLASRTSDRISSDHLGIGGVPSEPAFRRLYGTDIKSLSRDVFSEVITANVLGAIMRYIYTYTAHQVETKFASGIVVAGYGKNQLFPEVHQYIVDGKDALFVRQWIEYKHDFNEDDTRKTAIIPFAQADIFYLFMEGIHPDYLSFIERLLGRVLDEKSDALVNDYVSSNDRFVEKAKQKKDNAVIVRKFLDEFESYRHKEVVSLILDVVRALPKDEMAELAGALVELTSLRRKVDSPLESVGGPVDVAVISKGDGLIWVKRKHYFDIEKNRDFLYRKEHKGRISHAAQQGP